MPSLLQILLYIHVLAAFTFLLAHGVAIFVSFQLKKEEETEHMKALLNLSASAWPSMMLSLLVLMLAGITLAFVVSAWGRLWVWTSVILLLGLTVWMFRVGQGTYQPLRKMLGMVWLIQGKPQPTEKARPLSEIKAYLAKTRPMEMTVVGVGGFALILLLMMFKPF